MTAFLGYVLPYGQMSLWGNVNYKFNTTKFKIYNSILNYINILQNITYLNKVDNNNIKELMEIKSKPDKKFMSMFIGFIDGDGYFDIGEQKQYNKTSKKLIKSTIRIRLASNVHYKDLSLLEYFVKIIGTGKISKMSNRDQVRIIFYKKDLVSTLLPLIKNYNLEFLTKERRNQYKLLNYILNNNIINWKDINFNNIDYDVEYPNYKYYINLDFFKDWIVGFTIAEGSFFIKKNNYAYFQIRQTGIESYEIIKGICIMIANRKSYVIKPDKSNSYQLSLSSREDLQNVINFFSSSSNYKLLGYKYIQYLNWLIKIKEISKYKELNFPIS